MQFSRAHHQHYHGCLLHDLFWTKELLGSGGGGAWEWEECKEEEKTKAKSKSGVFFSFVYKNFFLLKKKKNVQLEKYGAR